jgi:ectoine hydroxylase-related dioxygenase (phytanoyl-CoA dioxygenase family)
MNIERSVAEFRDHGFAVVRNLFSADEVARIEREVQAYVRDVAPALPHGRVYYEAGNLGAVKSLHGMEQASRFFAELARDGRLIGIVRSLWPGGEVVTESVMFFGKPAGDGSEAPPHQDNTFQCLNPPDALTLTIAIDESTPENGALTFQRGSHRAGLLAHRQSGVMGFSRCLVGSLDQGQYPPVQALMRPGDVCLHHVNTIHWSGPNRSPRPRRQLGIGYRSSLARLDRAAWEQYQSDLRSLHQSAATQGPAA